MINSIKAHCLLRVCHRKKSTIKNFFLCEVTGNFFFILVNLYGCTWCGALSSVWSQCAFIIFVFSRVYEFIFSCLFSLPFFSSVSLECIHPFIHLFIRFPLFSSYIYNLISFSFKPEFLFFWFLAVQIFEHVFDVSLSWSKRSTNEYSVTDIVTILIEGGSENIFVHIERKYFNGCNGRDDDEYSPRGYLYIIILAMGSFNDTQFNMFRSLLLLTLIPQSNMMNSCEIFIGNYGFAF